MKTLLILALVASSCASMKARDEVLLPTAQLAWVGVRADLERGIADTDPAPDAKTWKAFRWSFFGCRPNPRLPKKWAEQQLRWEFSLGVHV